MMRRALESIQKKIWEIDKKDNEEADCSERSGGETGKKITTNKLILIQQTFNCKLLVLEGVQSYWVKDIKILHPRMKAVLNGYRITDDLLVWLTKGENCPYSK